MSRAQKIGVAAILVFGVSHFLPSFGGLRGYACFQECWRIVMERDMTNVWGWLYYSGFVLSSILFLILGTALLMTERGRSFGLIASAIMLLHTLSWFFVNIKDLSKIGIGYYVWLVGYALLLTAYLVKPTRRWSPTTGVAPAAAF